MFANIRHHILETINPNNVRYLIIIDKNYIKTSKSMHKTQSGEDQHLGPSRNKPILILSEASILKPYAPPSAKFSEKMYIKIEQPHRSALLFIPYRSVIGGNFDSFACK